MVCRDQRQSPHSALLTKVINLNLSIFRAYRVLWDPVCFMSGRSVPSHNKFHAVTTKNKPDKIKVCVLKLLQWQKVMKKVHSGRLSSFMAGTKAWQNKSRTYSPTLDTIKYYWDKVAQILHGGGGGEKKLFKQRIWKLITKSTLSTPLCKGKYKLLTMCKIEAVLYLPWRHMQQ
jgi:hypothetical protein